MQNINYCTTGANQNGGSLLSTTISSITTQNVSNVILPYATLLTTGKYLSKVVAVDEGVFKDKPYIDCTHELTAPDGEVRRVKFRFFAPTETDELFQKLAEYGLAGTVAEVLVGLEEDVTLSQRTNGSKYLYISHRVLATPTVSTPPTKKSSIHGKRNYFGSKAIASSKSPRETLLEDDDDDDFLEEDDM